MHYLLPARPVHEEALEPVIDARTMELRYKLHHKSAVVAANKCEEAPAKARHEMPRYGKGRVCHEE